MLLEKMALDIWIKKPRKDIPVTVLHVLQIYSSDNIQHLEATQTICNELPSFLFTIKR